MRSAIKTNWFFSVIAAIIASRRIPEARLNEVSLGVIRGISPPPRIALYGVGCNSCLEISEEDFSLGIKAATSRKVNVISISICRQLPAYFYKGDPHFFTGDLEMLEAFKEGILSVRSAGNLGCTSVQRLRTIAKSPPWCLTVASCTSERRFRTVVEFGSEADYDFKEIKGFSINTTKKLGWAKLSKIGEIFGQTSVMYPSKGEIVIRATSNFSYIDCGPSNTVIVNFNKDQSTKIAEYFNIVKNDNASLFVQINPSVRVAIADSPLVSDFSSRGPCSHYKNFMKPDISAPGEQIAAAWPSDVPLRVSTNDPCFASYNIMSGTSFAVPHVAAVAATLHAEKKFSASAIMSAIITTAKKMHGRDDIACEYAYGAGIIDAKRAMRPGLVYEEDFANYNLYAEEEISHFNLNLPYFSTTIPDGEGPWCCKFKRKVKSVEIGRCSYGLSVEIRKNSFNMAVSDIQISPEPTRLVFEEFGSEQTFVLSVHLPHTRAPKKSFGLISASLYLTSEDNEQLTIDSPIIFSSEYVPPDLIMLPLYNDQTVDH